MHKPTRLCQSVVAALALAVAVPCAGGNVDFSENLLTWTSKHFGREAPSRLLVWQKLVRDIKGATGSARSLTDAQTIQKVNDFFNQVPYYTDQELWGVDDYWATPIEMLGAYGGTCHDYVIAKYLTLKELGIPIERLRLTYVEALKQGQAHMVLAYYAKPDADPLILDNLIPEILPASRRTDLEPVYSFNDDDLWVSGGAVKKGGAAQVRQWRNLVEKLNRELTM